MKRISAIYTCSIVLLCVVGINACKEVGPNINLRNNQNAVADTTYVESPVATAEPKNVVIEEFTGVRCPNCPQGHVIIANIKTANPGKVFSVSLHPINSLGAPYPFSAHDFSSQNAQDLFDYFVQLGFEPAAAVDRIPAGGSSVLFDKSVWSTKVTSQLAVTTPVNISLSSTYDSSNREVTVVTELHYTQNVTEKNKLTILLTESDMETAQLDGSVIDTFYVHKDIMRDFITNLKGDEITATLEPGRVVRKVYKKILDAGWKPENMKVLAYVHQFENAKQVYQAKEVDVQ